MIIIKKISILLIFIIFLASSCNKVDVSEMSELNCYVEIISKNKSIKLNNDDLKSLIETVKTVLANSYMDHLELYKDVPAYEVEEFKKNALCVDIKYINPQELYVGTSKIKADEIIILIEDDCAFILYDYCESSHVFPLTTDACDLIKSYFQS